MNFPFVEISSLKLSLITNEELFSLYKKAISEKKKSAVICADFRLINHFSNGGIRLLDEAVYYPDSTGVYLALKTFFRDQSQGFKKLVSTDIHYKLLRYAADYGLSVYLLGGTDEVLAMFIEKAYHDFTNFKVAGYSNGFVNDENLIHQINDSGADILFVGMGVPKQELWITENYSKVNVPLIINVGAFFSFYSGFSKRAPELMRTLSLEWLFRLLQEPVRLWKRYLLEYPAFIINLLKGKG